MRCTFLVVFFFLSVVVLNSCNWFLSGIKHKNISILMMIPAYPTPYETCIKKMQLAWLSANNSRQTANRL